MEETSPLGYLEQNEFELVWRRAKGQPNKFINDVMGIGTTTHARWLRIVYKKVGIDLKLNRIERWEEFLKKFRGTLVNFPEQDVRTWEPRLIYEGDLDDAEEDDEELVAEDVEVEELDTAKDQVEPPPPARVSDAPKATSNPPLETPEETSSSPQSDSQSSQVLEKLPGTNLGGILTGFLIAGVLFAIIYFLFRRQPPQTPVVITATLPDTPVITEQPVTAPTAAQTSTSTAVSDTPTNTSVPPTTSTSTLPPITPTLEVIGPPPLFEDNFDSGVLAAGWNPPVDENAYAFGGVLNMRDDATLSVGNINWTNYEISFTIINTECSGERWSWVGVRATSQSNFMKLWICTEMLWSELDNGQRNDLDATRITVPLANLNVVIRVEGKQYKEEEEFNGRSKNLGIRAKTCRDCAHEFNKTYFEGPAKERHLQQVRERKQAAREYARDYITEYLKTHPCETCGESDIRVLKFHHVGDKDMAVGAMVSGGYSVERITREIQACQVLCANCHRKITVEERGWFRGKK